MSIKYFNWLTFFYFHLLITVSDFLMLLMGTMSVKIHVRLYLYCNVGQLGICIIYVIPTECDTNWNFCSCTVQQHVMLWKMQNMFFRLDVYVIWNVLIFRRKSINMLICQRIIKKEDNPRAGKNVKRKYCNSNSLRYPSWFSKNTLDKSSVHCHFYSLESWH